MGHIRFPTVNIFRVVRSTNNMRTVFETWSSYLRTLHERPSCYKIFDSTVHSIFSACPMSEVTAVYTAYERTVKKNRYKQKCMGKGRFSDAVFFHYFFIFILRLIIILSSRHPYITNVHPTLYIVYQPVWRQYMGNYYYCDTFRELCM